MDTRTAQLKLGLLERIRELGFDGNRHADEIARSWRSLTEGAKTLIGVSGGADSLALLISLRRATDQLVASYIRHDQRSIKETDVEQQWVKEVAEALGIPYVPGEAHASEGNIEAALRTARYAALESIARDHECAFIATGHHADDQLETILHALIRGTGPSGIAGMRDARPLDDRLTLIRPMLTVTHDDALAICSAAGVSWFEDPTNAHIEHTRALLRTKVLPVLRSINPSASANASRAASLLGQSAAALSVMASEALADANTWPRERLASLPPIVLTTALRNRILVLTNNQHADRLSHQRLDEVALAIADNKHHLRQFNFPNDITIAVHAHRVELCAPIINP